MEFNKKLSSFDFTGALAMVGGLAFGCVAGRTAYAAIHDDAKAGTEAEKKTNKMVGYGKRLAIAGVGVAGTAAVKGSDAMSVAAKAFGAGMAAIQVVDATKTELTGSATATKLTSGNKAAKALAKGLGLGCPCDTPVYNAVPMNGPRRRRRTGMGNPNLVALGNPRFTDYQGAPIVQLPSTSFSNAVAKGSSISVTAA